MATVQNFLNLKSFLERTYAQSEVSIILSVTLTRIIIIVLRYPLKSIGFSNASLYDSRENPAGDKSNPLCFVNVVGSLNDAKIT